MSTTQTNLNTFLDKLQKATSVEFELFVPSLGRIVTFKPLTAGQQKSLIKTVLDKALMGATFTLTLNKILVENSIESVQFTVADRTALAVQLRSISLGNEVDVDGKTIDISKLVENIKAGKLTQPPKEKPTLTSLGIEVSVDYPTLFTDNQGYDYLFKLYKNDLDDKTKSSTIFEKILTVEISKFVTQVKFEGDVIDLKLLTVPQRLQIIDNLPADINKGIMDFSVQLKKQEDLYTTVDSGVQFTVDSSFFTVVKQ